MSAISDAIAAASASQDQLEASLTELEGRVSTDIPGLKKTIDDLTAQVAALQAQIDAGNSDPALVQAVQTLQGRIDQSKQRLVNVDPAIASPPPPQSAPSRR
jgi:uncharacterized coiled-coil protein SlyX